MGKKQAQTNLQAENPALLTNATDFFDKCIGYGTAALLFILPFLMHARFYDGSFAMKRAALEIVVPFLLGLCALRLFLNKKDVEIKVTWLSLGIIAFLIWNWFSLSWSYHVYEAYLSALRWTASILPFFLLAACKRKSHWIQLWLGTLIAASIAISLLGICQTLFIYLKDPLPNADISIFNINLSILPLEQLILPFERYVGSTENVLWSMGKPLWFLNKILFVFYKCLGQAAAPSATFINRNFAMHFVNFMLPISFIWVWRAIKPASIIMGLVAVSLHCIYIFRANSRAALIAFGVMFICLTIVMIVNDFSKYKLFKVDLKRIAGLIIALVFIISLSLLPNILSNSSIAEKFTSLFSSGASTGDDKATSKNSTQEPAAQNRNFADKSLDPDTDLDSEEASFGKFLQRKAEGEPRFSMWFNTLGIILDYPLRGVGTGNFRTYYPKYQGYGLRNEHLALGSRPEHAHNDYLQMFAELGIIGLAIFMLILCAVFWGVATLVSSNKINSRNRLFVIGISIALIGLFIVMLFSFPMDRAIPPFLLFLCLGIINSLYRRDCPKAAEKIIALPAITFGLIALLLVLATGFMFYENAGNLKYAFLHQKMLEYEKLGKWEEIIPDGVEATRVVPEATRHLFYIGRAYAETGDLINATKIMERSLEMDPYSAVSLTNYGVILGRRALFIAASWELGRGVKLTPHFALGRVNYGFSLIKIDKIEEGIAQFHKAIELNKSDRYAYMHLALTLKKVGRLEESLATYLKSAEMCTNDPLAQYEAGRELLQRNRIQEAVPYYKKSVDINPMSIKICFELAKLYEVVDKPDWARQLYVHILKNISPRDKKTKAALSDLLTRLKKAQEAAEAEAAKTEPDVQ